MAAQSTEMFGLTVQGQTASEACPVSCGTCPTCDDRIQNGDEMGVDCGGSCAAMCDSNASCEPFSQSQFVQPNSEPVCSDGAGVAARAICHLIAHPGFYTASIGAAAAVCNGQECEELATTMFVPPTDVNPGKWTCTDGEWVGLSVPLLPIVPTMCDTFIKENHYTATCATDGSPCQATCDVGYPQAGGDGVFSCVNGRWIGYLLCLPIDCGHTLDQQPINASAYSECTDGTTLSSECEAHCIDGFYAESGTGIATFTCSEKYNGAWLQQGHLFYESSLVCTKCPTIENCRVSSCSTDNDVICHECEVGYFMFRHDEDRTRCLAISTAPYTTSGFNTVGGQFTFLFFEDVGPYGEAIVADGVLAKMNGGAAQRTVYDGWFTVQGGSLVVEKLIFTAKRNIINALPYGGGHWLTVTVTVTNCAFNNNECCSGTIGASGENTRFILTDSIFTGDGPTGCGQSGISDLYCYNSRCEVTNCTFSDPTGVGVRPVACDKAGGSRHYPCGAGQCASMICGGG
eukprot:SAG22_NODE_3038_length_2004_cov_4.699738_2_plen_516_part_00